MKALGELTGSIMRRLTRRRRFPLLVRRNGAQFLLDPRSWLDSQIALRADYEQHQISRALELVRAERLTIVVDVGANLGLYTVLLGQLPDVEQVIAFEPVRRTFHQLCANVFANRLDRKVTAHQLALGGSASEMVMHIDPRSSVVARFVPTLEGRSQHDFSEQEPVHVVPFDSLVSLSGARVFVKIDVEGHAAAVIAGMRRFLAENYAILQVELFAEDQERVLEELERLGYASVEAVGRDHYFRRRSPAEQGS